MQAREIVSPRYRAEVLFALSAQLLVGLIALRMLDGGRLAKVVGMASLAFWLSTTLMARRPEHPTKRGGKHSNGPRGPSLTDGPAPATLPQSFVDKR